MADAAKSLSSKKCFALLTGGLLAFLLLSVVAIRTTVRELFDGIASSRSSGLSAIGWDTRSMWSDSPTMRQKSASGEAWIARSADLQTHSSEFDDSAASVHRIVSAHHGYFEDLRTESRSGFGRSLAAAVAVPSDEFDALIEDYRAPLQVSLTGATLQLRNSFADGISTIFSTLALVFRIVLSYGLPVVFWLALLFWPLRYSYRRLRNRTATLSNAA